MKKKILLAEDDEFLRTAIKNMLEENDYEVLEAPNGKLAKEVINASDTIDLILSDIQMPFLDGIELLTWVKENRPTRFVLMTGFSHLLETISAYELGAEGFIAKPFNYNELLKILNEVLSKTDSLLEEAPAEKYCRVSIDDFVSSRGLDISVYIKLSDVKFIKIAEKGSELEQERISAYKKKGVEQLYVRQDEFQQLVNFNIKLSKLVADSKKVDFGKKKRFLGYTGEILLERIFVSEVNQEVFDAAKSFLNTCIDFFADQIEIVSLLDLLNEHDDFLYAHSLGVSLYSTMIAKQIGWESPSTIFKVAAGGLFHDIGLKEVDSEILKKPRASLSFQERGMLESHTLRGKEILQSLAMLPSDIVAIAYQHHETILGSGFPQNLTKNAIHPMSKIVSVANEFCNIALKGHNTPGCHGSEAIKILKESKADCLDKQALLALSKCVSTKAD